MNNEHTFQSSAIGELYQHHSCWLTDWLRRRLGCPHRAADLAHDTFERLLGMHAPAGLREPRAFLTTIARGLVVDHRRREALGSWTRCFRYLSCAP